MRLLAAVVVAAIPMLAVLLLISYSAHAPGQTAKNQAELQLAPFLTLVSPPRYSCSSTAK